MRVHLIDGTYELFRAYFGAPGRLDVDGKEIGATRALCSSLAALLADPTVTHVAIAFDHVIESFRNELFAGYKTGDGIEPALFGQFQLAEDACKAMGLVVWSMVEFEADDALATGAHKFGQERHVEQVLLCSPDKDLAQCVRGSRVVCWDRMRNKIYDDAGVKEKFGIGPQSIPDYLALVGDTADGIPGVPRWGAKSSAAVLAQYLHLEHIPASAADWQLSVRGAPALAASLAERKQDALLYRRLATLREDVPLAEELSDLRYRGPVEELLQPLLQYLEFPELMTRLRAISV